MTPWESIGVGSREIASASPRPRNDEEGKERVLAITKEKELEIIKEKRYKF